jgi:hypothetical protein
MATTSTGERTDETKSVHLASRPFLIARLIGFLFYSLSVIFDYSSYLKY